MSNIVSAELFRLFKTKWFKKLMIAFSIVAAAIVAIAFAVIAFVIGLYGAGSEEMVWQGYAPTASLLLLRNFGSTGTICTVFTLIAVAVFTCKELSERTVSYALVAGKSRAQIFFAYLLVGGIIGAIFFTINALFTGIGVFVMCGLGQVAAADVISAYVTSFVIGLFATAYCVCCVVMFAFATQSQGATIMLPLVLCMFVPSGIGTIVTIAQSIATVNGYMLSAETLSWIPFYNEQIFEPFAPNCWTEMLKVILYSAVLAGGFVGLGYVAAKKAEIK